MTEFSRLRQLAGLSLQGVVDRTGYALRTVYRWERGEAAPGRAAIECLQQAVAHPPATGGAFEPGRNLFSQPCFLRTC